MAEPLLDFGDIGLVVKRVSGSRRAQRMNAEAFNLRSKARLAAVFADDVGVRVAIGRKTGVSGAIGLSQEVNQRRLSD